MATAVLVLAGTALLFAGVAAGGPDVAALGWGSASALVAIAASCSALGAVLVRCLATAPVRTGAPWGTRTSDTRLIGRAQDPGRPGRPQPRAPGAALLPVLAR